ncbi:MAG: transketolase [Defluviitaleaceae bacterium]|nr:transketolase [Defluviitaleaceae bacterium]
MAYSKELLQELKARAMTLRKNIVYGIGSGKIGHLGGSFSAVEIVAALYFYKMRHDPKNPDLADRDRFLLSKGHAAVVQYSALAEAGYFPREELANMKNIGSMLQGHPDKLKTPGVEANTGSLGQGLSIGLGLALGLRLDKIQSKVYVLVGDGELAEGQIWEAAMAASVHKTNNLVAILDCNKVQAMGKTSDRFPINKLSEKWADFGWNVIEADGHNMEEVVSALDKADGSPDKPTIIIAHTVKGKGLEAAEKHESGFHNALVTEEIYSQAMKLFGGA